MQLEFWSKTDKGLRRESNQDSLLINLELGLFIVADGMGGHNGGEIASAMAVRVVEDFISHDQKKEPIQRLPPKDILFLAYKEASAQIYKKATEANSHLTGMGTTMVSLYFFDGTFYIGNVGDSRAYLFRKPNLWQLTEDHSLVNEQVRAGLLTDEQAINFVGKNVITRSVGYESDVIADVIERSFNPGDQFLLCSDGLSGLVSDQEISDILEKYPSHQVVDECVELALKKGGFDNISVMLIKTGSY